MTFGTSKDGGDVSQVNIGTQDNASTQSVTGVANAGTAVIGSIGSASLVQQAAHELVDQFFGQANVGSAGNAGSDNTHSGTHVSV